MARLTGHAWTIAPALRHMVVFEPGPAAQEIRVEVRDKTMGRVGLTSQLRKREGTTLAVLVHGIGGSPASHYMVEAARDLDTAGLSCLRVALRGADRSGDDFYHAGLREDLDAILAAPELQEFERIVVVGFSLGGHMVLRWALDPSDPRVRGVAAVSSPLDLDAAATAIDGPNRSLYRRHVLRGLKDIYGSVARRRPVPTPATRVDQVKSIREYDRLTVVPRHGFSSVRDYYESQSVGPRLAGLRLPALYVGSRSDPMIPLETVKPFLSEAPAQWLTVRMTNRGGHVAFPGDLDLDLGGGAGLTRQLLGFFSRC